MKPDLKSILFAAALASTGSIASAADINWGVHDYPNPEFFFQAVSGSFTDHYTFTMPADFVGVTSVTVSNDNAPGLLITGGMFSLYSNADGIVGNGDDALVGGAWAFDGTTGTTQHTVAIAPGDYYYAVSGMGAGIAGQGAYIISSQLQPIPEPETYGMLLGGLGLLGFMLRRRK